MHTVAYIVEVVGDEAAGYLGPESVLERTLNDLDHRALDGFRALTSIFGKPRGQRRPTAD